jgi:hypothetical protein
MRRKEAAGGLSVHATAGTHAVLLGIDLTEAQAKGLLGFAIWRDDHTESEGYWLKGLRTFAETGHGVPPGVPIPLRDHPLQGFLWGDYTAKPRHRYTYRVVALRGSPKRLQEAESVSVDVETESEDVESSGHAVYFNRGLAATRAYALKFNNIHPDAVPDGAAYAWLSRGLFEGLNRFLSQATGPGWGIRAAVYEFTAEPVLAALSAARARGVDVRIVFDAKRNGSVTAATPAAADPRERNLRAIEVATLADVCKPREMNPSYIAHNKFLVLTRDNNPVAVWTGSTNLTKGGFYGHSNVGHAVWDPQVAGQFLAYWTYISNDPDAKSLRTWTEQASPLPGQALPAGCSVVFSPRADLRVLDWYCARMMQARAMFLTAAFGVNDRLEQVFAVQSDSLRYLLLDKKDEDMELLNRDQNNRVSVGAIPQDPLSRHLAQVQVIANLNRHVRFIHTKYLLVDPLSDDPLVVTGSANFSDASTRSNDENMLVIRGEKRVADIYLGEFMRLFNYFLFSSFETGGEGSPRRHLTPSDEWAEAYFAPSSPKSKERRFFAVSP